MKIVLAYLTLALGVVVIWSECFLARRGFTVSVVGAGPRAARVATVVFYVVSLAGVGFGATVAVDYLLRGDG